MSCARTSASKPISRSASGATAFDIWHSGERWHGTPVEDYLRRCRGIIELPERLQLRYAPDRRFFPWRRNKRVRPRKAPRVIWRGPAMLAPDHQRHRHVPRCTIITWIDLDLPNGKAIVVDPGKRRGPAEQKGPRLAGWKRDQGWSMRPGRRGTSSARASKRFCRPGAPCGRRTADLAGVAFWSLVALGTLPAGKAAAVVSHPTLKDAKGRTRRVPGPDPHAAGGGLTLPASATDVVLLAQWR